MKKTSADMITGAMAAEAALAESDAVELEESVNSLPDDHPVKVAASMHKKMMGDLAGLPPGHPLLIAMEEARLRYEAEQGVASQEQVASEDLPKIKRAKRLDAKKADNERRRSEAEREERIRGAARSINASMSETMDSLRRLQDNISATQQDFVGDRYAQMKLERLSRLLVATMRGLSESKINAGRVVANG